MTTPPQGRWLGASMVAISGIAFGTLGVFGRGAIGAGLTVPQLLCLRFLGGAAVMWLLAVSRRELVRLPATKLAGLALMGAFFVGEAWLYFESSRRIPVALTALLLYLFPAIVVLVSWVALRRPPGRWGALALVLTSIGISLAIGAPVESLDLLGLVLGAGSAISYSGYILLGAKVHEGLAPTLSSAVVMTAAGLLFGIASLFGAPLEPSAVGAAWPSLLGVVLVGTVIPIPLLLFGIARIGPTRASIISTLEPVTAALCGLVVLHEALSPLQWTGAGLVVGGVLLAAKS